MKLEKAIDYCLRYHKANSKNNTYDSYKYMLSKFSNEFPDRELDSISTDEILSFLTQLCEGRKQATKRSRFAILSAFFALIKDSICPELENPCDNPLLRKIFTPAKYTQWKKIEKEVIDEIIFKIPKIRNRLLVEIMARSGLRIGEVLKLTVKNIENQKLLLMNPKSGNDEEAAYIPQKVAQRLLEYTQDKGFQPSDRIFPIRYAAARVIVKNAGKLVGIDLRPHDLRRYAATYASRSGVPIEIVSKVILRHANLSTTQRYLGKVTDAEAIRWIERLYE